MNCILSNCIAYKNIELEIFLKKKLWFIRINQEDLGRTHYPRSIIILTLNVHSRANRMRITMVICFLCTVYAMCIVGSQVSFVVNVLLCRSGTKFVVQRTTRTHQYDEAMRH